MEKFEYFIIKNKQLFNKEKLNKNLWKDISNKLKTQNANHKIRVYYKIAASFAVFIALSFLIFNIYKKNIYPPNFKEFKEMKKYYNSLISSKYAEIEKISKNNPFLIKEIETNLKILDSIYYDLQKDMKEKIANKIILEAMIQNYQKKLYILEQILSQIKEETQSVDIENNNNNLESYDL